MLVLEDDEATRRLLRLLLEEELRVEVAEAGDSDCALELLQAAPTPALIVVDLMLPDLDGETFMRVVRQRFGPDLPIMVLSALGHDQVEKGAARGEAQKFMVKPFNVNEFLAAVSDLLWGSGPLD